MVIIATEKVQPLSSVTYVLQDKFDEYLISWGLHQVLVRNPSPASLWRHLHCPHHAVAFPPLPDRVEVLERRLLLGARGYSYSFRLCGSRGRVEALWL